MSDSDFNAVNQNGYIIVQEIVNGIRQSSQFARDVLNLRVKQNTY